MNDDAIRELSASIILQAVSDYMSAKTRIGRGNTDEKYKHRLNETTEFFNGGWFGMLSNFDADGKTVMKILDERVKEKIKKRRKKNGKVRS